MTRRDDDEEPDGYDWWSYLFAATVATTLMLVLVGARTLSQPLWRCLLMLFSVAERTTTRSVGTQTDMAPDAARAATAGDPTATRPATTGGITATFRLEYLTVDQLKTIGRLKNLPVTGLKGELIERLIRASQS
jgi:hypothetical protein